MTRSHTFYCGLILAVALSPAGRFHTDKAPPKEPALYDDAETYQVLSLILEKETRDSPQKLVRIYYLTDTNPLGVFRSTFATIGELRAAADDLKNKNKAPQKLRAKFKLSHTYKVVEYQSFPDNRPVVIPLADGTLPPPSEADEDEKISQGVFYVGAVGFDPTYTHAIAYLDWVCGTLCAQGSFYFLEKDKWGWYVTKTAGAWVH